MVGCRLSCFSFSISRLWGTVSIAFWKSKKHSICLCCGQDVLASRVWWKAELWEWTFPSHCASESGWCSVRWSVIRKWTCFSRSLLSIERSDIGLYPDGLCLAVDLGIDTTLADFHNLGKWPLVIDRLKRLVSEGAILSEVAFSLCAEIPSGPIAFNTSKPLRRCSISCVVQSKWSG